MNRVIKSSNDVKIDPDGAPLEVPARSIAEFKQAISQLATAAEQSADLGLHAMPYEQILSYISRLATILPNLATEPAAAAVLNELQELRIDMGGTVRVLPLRGSIH
jgi:hypothetical protein